MEFFTDTPAEDRLLRLPQVLEIIPISRATWYAGVNSGRFPKPIKFGVRLAAWRLSDIRALFDGVGSHQTTAVDVEAPGNGAADPSRVTPKETPNAG